MVGAIDQVQRLLRARITTRITAAFVLVSMGLVLPPQAGAQPLDCTGYDSQVWARSVYETDRTRYLGLDPDGNGLACEDLPPGAAPASWTDEIPAGAAPATLVDVSDGDTIQVSLNGQTWLVRLILIDTPETHDPDDPPECYGQEATAYLSWLLSLGGQLFLETDVTDRDRYDRLLRYAWLNFGDGHAYLVNEVMVRSGYAALYTYPPDVKYVEQIREAQTFAREHDYGLWSGCVTDAKGETNELTAPQPEPTVAVQPPSVAAPAPAPAPSGECDYGSYPDVCIPPIGVSGDLDCGQISARRFRVFPRTCTALMGTSTALAARAAN